MHRLELWQTGLALSVAATLATGCLPKTYVSVLEPADVTLPANVEQIAIIDRSRPANVGQGILGTIEGALTGEAIGADRDAGKEAVRGVTQVVGESPRFTSIVPPFDRQGQDSNLFDRELTWKQVKRICTEYDAQALVSLEALDSDSWITRDRYQESYTDDNGREVYRTVHTAQRDTRVTVAWRLYDVESGQILDDLRDYATTNTWTSEGPNPGVAQRGLPNQYDSVVSVGFESGLFYGKRIAPTYVWVERSYYGGGSADMKEAKRHVKADDWKGAHQIWLEVIRNTDDRKLRGKARFNRALYLEITGDLYQAEEVAQKAAIDLGNPRSRRYVRTIQYRIRAAERLKEQMKVEPSEPPADEGRPPQPRDGGAVARPVDDGGDTVSRGSGDDSVSRDDDAKKDDGGTVSRSPR